MPVLLFTLAACALSGILFGCAPAWQASRTDMNETLKESGRSVGRRTAPACGARSWSIEFALALTLLAGGGLAIHSLFKLATRRSRIPQRSSAHLLAAGPDGSLTATTQINAFYRQLLESLQAVPGVTSASVSTGMPVAGTGFGMPFEIAGKPVADPSKRPGAGFSMVTPGYFRTFGIEIKRGRGFTEQDRAAACTWPSSTRRS